MLDNAGIHRAKTVQAFVDLHERLSLVELPPYAPDLHPIELVGGREAECIGKLLCPFGHDVEAETCRCLAAHQVRSIASPTHEFQFMPRSIVRLWAMKIGRCAAAR